MRGLCQGLCWSIANVPSFSLPLHFKLTACIHHSQWRLILHWVHMSAAWNHIIRLAVGLRRRQPLKWILLRQAIEILSIRPAKHIRREFDSCLIPFLPCAARRWEPNLEELRQEERHKRPHKREASAYDSDGGLNRGPNSWARGPPCWTSIVR